jgi:hypothetical protein
MAEVFFSPIATCAKMQQVATCSAAALTDKQDVVDPAVGGYINDYVASKFVRNIMI